MLEKQAFDWNRIVLGTAGLAGLWGPVDEEESVRTLLTAMELGIRHFDTAPAYADAQVLLGKALKLWKGDAPYVSTKAGKLKSPDPGIAICNYSSSSILNSIEESRKILNKDVLDLVFLHDPVAMKEDEMQPAIDTLKELQAKGLIRQLGMGGHYGPEFEGHAVSGCFSHFMGFNRYNLVRWEKQATEYKMLREKGLEIWQASPLYMGLLGSKYAHYLQIRPEWIPSEDFEKVQQLNSYCEQNGWNLTGLALNFVYNSNCVNKLVLGACNVKELMDSIEHLQNNDLKEASLLMMR